MAKPKIYAICKAGCLWETVHKDDFDKSAAWIKQYPGESGVYSLPPVKNYKIVSPVSSSAYSCVVSLSYKDGTTEKTHAFTISEFDEYRDYFYFEILDLTATATVLKIVYEVNGNRYSEEISGTAISVSQSELQITGATAVFLFNADAEIKGDKGLDALTYRNIKVTTQPIPVIGTGASAITETFALVAFNRTPRVDEYFMCYLGEGYEPYHTYIARGKILSFDDKTVSVLLDSAADITGKQGDKGDKGDKGDSGTTVKVNGVEKETVEFDSDPQTQIDKKRAIVPPAEKGKSARIYSVYPKSDSLPDGAQGYIDAGTSNFTKYSVPQRSDDGQIELPNQAEHPPTINQAMSRREMRKYLPSITGVPSYKTGAFDEALPVDEKVTGVTDGSLVRRNADGEIMGTYVGQPSPLISEGQAGENFLGRFEANEHSIGNSGILELDNFVLKYADTDTVDSSGNVIVHPNGFPKRDEHGSLYSTAYKNGVPGNTEQVLTHQLARNDFALSEIWATSLWKTDWFGAIIDFNGTNDAELGNVHHAKIQITDNTNFPNTSTSESTAYLVHIDYSMAVIDLYTRTLNANGDIAKLDIYKGVYLYGSHMVFKKALISSVEF